MDDRPWMKIYDHFGNLACVLVCEYVKKRTHRWV